MKKQLIYLFIATVIVGLGLTSCLKDNNENTNDSSMAGYFTIEGTFPNYKFITDNGIIVFPTQDCLIKVTNNKGFGNFKRVYLSLVFNMANMKTDEVTKVTTVKDATIINGQLIETTDPIDVNTATAKKINVADSLFDVKKLHAWGGVTGYLSAIVTSEYYLTKNDLKVVPSFNIVYDKADIKENAVKLTFCSNQHRSKDAKNVANISLRHSEFNTAFLIKDIIAQVPGKDSVKVTLTGQGFEPKEIKFGRNIR